MLNHTVLLKCPEAEFVVMGMLLSWLLSYLEDWIQFVNFVQHCVVYYWLTLDNRDCDFRVLLVCRVHLATSQLYSTTSGQLMHSFVG